jgi:ketosteroid isomerase-like protein
MTTAGDVQQASARFYTALNRMLNGDPGPMRDVWARGVEVTTMDPIGEREVGWEQVQAVWEQVATAFTGGQVRVRDQLFQVAGDLAYEIGIEEGEATLAGERVPIKQRVTNIYRREGSEWKIVHHHTDASPAMQELLSRLQGPLP